MPLIVEAATNTVSVDLVLKRVVLTSLSFLSALSFREFLVSATKSSVPVGTKESLVFVAFIAVFVLLITIVIAVVWT